VRVGGLGRGGRQFSKQNLKHKKFYFGKLIKYMNLQRHVLKIPEILKRNDTKKFVNWITIKLLLNSFYFNRPWAGIAWAV